MKSVEWSMRKEAYDIRFKQKLKQYKISDREKEKGRKILNN